MMHGQKNIKLVDVCNIIWNSKFKIKSLLSMGGIIPDIRQQVLPHSVTSVYITLVKRLTKWSNHINQSFCMRQSG
jgi:hypothetical protein